MRLISNSETIQDRYGLDPVKQLLFTNIRLDSRKMVTPFLVETDSGPFLMARQQELGNLLSAGVRLADLKLYEPWVTIDKRITAGIDVLPKFADVVADLAGDGPVEFDDGIPLVHLHALAGRVEVTIPPAAQQKVRVYQIENAGVLAQFRALREAGVAVARTLAGDIKHLAGLDAEFDAETDTRFTGLDALAGRLEVAGFILASPPNFSEVAGYPGDEESFALWRRDSDAVLIIAPAEATNTPGAPLGVFDSAAHAVAHFLHGAPVGVEEQWISARFGLELQGIGLQTVNASIPLGHWRDIRDQEDLSFQFIAARASVTCIEEALEYAQVQISSGNPLTENDVYRKYLEAIQSFRDRHQIPFCIEPYFTNLHSSTRMLFPGPPTDFPLDFDTKCIQLDAGVKVTAGGVVLATSDMARSLLLTPEGKEAYDLLTQVVREDIVGALRPGAVCSDVHAQTMVALTAIRPQLEALGMLAEGVDFVSEYKKRNVGHLMGKQESFANELRPGYDNVLHVGSLGAAEIPWRFGDYAIGTEDMWYIGADKTFVITLR
ncbi:M24 family metallopeptidase [Specibacter sp. RAF43]|uniref:M24 family metallopeptidase n=1 Tax=Specibacter sp. RAF43 TaxID=3233057 RepID=UPI003F945C13